MLKEGSSGLNETRLRANKIPNVSTTNPMNSFNLRCSEGIKYVVHFIADDFSGIETRKREGPQSLVQFYKSQTSKCCAFEDSASGKRWPCSPQSRTKRSPQRPPSSGRRRHRSSRYRSSF